MALSGDQGARAVVQAHPNFLLSVEDAGCVHDVDTPEALEVARRLLS